MEKEHLSNFFIQKYDPMTDSFVVVENDTKEKRKFMPLSFFRFNSKNKTMREETAEPTLPPNQVEQGNPVDLSKELYNRIKILSSLYNSMATIDPANANEYKTLAGETQILQNTTLSIYQILSGNNNVPEQTLSTPTLSNSTPTALGTVQEFLQTIIDTSLKLQRVVNVDNINRQLVIVTATLLSQKNKLSALQQACKGEENEQ